VSQNGGLSPDTAVKAGEDKLHAEAKTELQEQLSGGGGALKKYQDMFVGRRGLYNLFYYEAVNLFFNNMPGMFGLGFRQKLFRRMFKKCGRGVIFGRGMTIRCPSKIEIGAGTIFDDYTVLDAKGDGAAIRIGAGALICRGTVLSCKGAGIDIGENTNIGQYNLIHAESPVRVGKNILTAAYCYLVGGGNHDFSRVDVPIVQQPSIRKGGIDLGDGTWLGAHVTVLDGVKIGRDCVIGAGSVVNKKLPDFSVAIGTPARVLKNRLEEAQKAAAHKTETAPNAASS
jgi:acetyltransferase-like isoleucine patch superfamily enzyme